MLPSIISEGLKDSFRSSAVKLPERPCSQARIWLRACFARPRVPQAHPCAAAAPRRAGATVSTARCAAGTCSYARTVLKVRSTRRRLLARAGLQAGRSADHPGPRMSVDGGCARAARADSVRPPGPAAGADAHARLRRPRAEGRGCATAARGAMSHGGATPAQIQIPGTRQQRDCSEIVRDNRCKRQRKIDRAGPPADGRRPGLPHRPRETN